MKEKAVFLDKDGTLIYNVPYNVDPARVRFYEEAFEALALLKREGYKIIIISNQSGVAYGYITEEEVADHGKYIGLELQKQGLSLDGFYYCPHHEEGKTTGYNICCECRKPKPGMILKAAADFNIDLGRSWMIGDILHDVQAGNSAGCRTILIDNGNETEWVMNKERTPGFIVKNLREAAEKILNNFSGTAMEKGGVHERAIEESGR